MKNDKLIQTYVNKDVKDWLAKEAEKNSRSSAAQNRHWLMMIKSGKIKVDGVG